MAWRQPVVQDNLAGQTTITFVLPWDELQEMVFLNGSKLVRGDTLSLNDYIVSRSTESLDPGLVDTITLTNPIADNADVLELLVYDDPVGETVMRKLDDILTATIGSWLWDKSEGLMTMYDVTGNEKFKFTVADTAEEASRERRTDLEL